MKKLAHLLSAVALLAPLASSAAPFEGKVTMNMTGARGETHPITFSLKSGFSRIDLTGPQGQPSTIIYDTAKHESIMLIPQRKMYMVNQLPPAPTAQTPEQQKSGEVNVEKTGEHEKILGYDATKYVAKSADGTTELWMSDELGTFMGLSPGGGPMGGNPMGGGFGRPGGAPRGPAKGAWEDAFKGQGLFPLRVVTKNASGKETFRMEATAIDKVSLPDSDFGPPAGYQKFDLGAMMRGMGGFPGMPGKRPASEDN